jgi:hypothetical protein
MPQFTDLAHSWRNIAIALTDLQKGEEKAQACDI